MKCNMSCVSHFPESPVLSMLYEYEKQKMAALLSLSLLLVACIVELSLGKQKLGQVKCM